MQEGDALLSIDSTGGIFETRVARAKHEVFDGKIVVVYARGLNMAVAGDFRVAKVGGTRLRTKPQFSLLPWSQLPGQVTVLRSLNYVGNKIETIQIPHTGGRSRKLNQPHEFDVEDYASLVGWYVSEGYRVHRDKAIAISQVKRENRDEIIVLLERIGYSYSSTAKDFYIYRPSLYKHMERYGDGCQNKMLTRAFKGLPRHALEEFFASAMLDDGCGSYYYTTSKRLADDFAEISLKTGRLVYTSQRQSVDRVVATYQVSSKLTKSGGTELLTGNHRYEIGTSTRRSSDLRTSDHKGYV